MTKAQMGDAIDRLVARMAKSKPESDNSQSFGAELKAGCPTLAKSGQGG